MAILSKIRERSMFLILVIGLALFAFVLDPSTLGDFFNSSKINEVGDINGETISRQEFAEALELYQTQNGNRVSEMQASKIVWDNLVRQKLYTAQLEEAGITLGEQDIMNVLYQTPSVQNDPRFQTAGMFDKSKFLEYLATIKEDSSQKETWNSWQSYMSSIGDNLKRTTYDDLIGAGLGASLKEGEAQYLNENTKISGSFVYVPYTSVADSLIALKKSDIQNYIDANPADFKTEASRDIKYVKFDILPTAEDELAIKNEIGALLEDNEQFASKGLKNATDYVAFLDENKSDEPLNNNYMFKNDLFAEVAEGIMSKNVGEVFGPYKDRGFYKISKVTEVAQMPDSVKASHILIPFLGSRSATAETTLVEDDARIQADSILSVLKRNRNKFSDLAKKFSVDKTNADKGGELDWFAYNRMVPEFRDYTFNNKKGDIGVVKSPFGFHIVKIDDQTKKQKVVKLATLSKRIVASEATENTVFQNAETFALEVSNGNSIDEAAKSKELQARASVGLKVLDENIAGLGNQRQIVSWAFGNDIEVGSFKRFDVDNGYVVATVTGKAEKGLLSVEKATARVRPLVLKEKKAALIKDKMDGATLADIASANGQSVKNISDVTLNSPTISGVGNEPSVIGAMINAKENELYNKIEGEKGVFAFSVSKKELPTALPNYDTYRKRIADQRRNQSFKMYEAIKKASDVEDNRASFYGIQ
ncbi:peptidylprolyl isomerase [Tenacibaculum aquimarinum]|uniref:peptidylprolyl isomerase n=1 Tax=Tenacibaculum aquimarinum TaxID=2910675 RepID=UPI001F0A2556|nr:peptidylprolyl isomerase [Tenacibaculum aquimarinum]MCH3884411.1 peptidylprolyl isomerase [Tenacibaculum aquimarinum]